MYDSGLHKSQFSINIVIKRPLVFHRLRDEQKNKQNKRDPKRAPFNHTHRGLVQELNPGPRTLGENQTPRPTSLYTTKKNHNIKIDHSCFKNIF